MTAKKKTAEKKTAPKKAATSAKSPKNEKLYSMNDDYQVGDILRHENILPAPGNNPDASTGDTGEVIETGVTTDGLNRMTVIFKSAGKKRLIYNLN